MNRQPSLNEKIKATRLVDSAIREMLAENGSLTKAESCILESLSLDSGNIEALQEAAHFYHAVNEQPRKAKKYALRCEKLATKLAKEMRQIISSR